VTNLTSEQLQALASSAKLKKVGKRQPIPSYIADTCSVDLSRRPWLDTNSKRRR
jgi:hypothetical protein